MKNKKKVVITAIIAIFIASIFVVFMISYQQKEARKEVKASTKKVEEETASNKKDKEITTTIIPQTTDETDTKEENTTVQPEDNHTDDIEAYKEGISEADEKVDTTYDVDTVTVATADEQSKQAFASESLLLNIKSQLYEAFFNKGFKEMQVITITAMESDKPYEGKYTAMIDNPEGEQLIFYYSDTEETATIQ